MCCQDIHWQVPNRDRVPTTPRRARAEQGRAEQSRADLSLETSLSLFPASLADETVAPRHVHCPDRYQEEGRIAKLRTRQSCCSVAQERERERLHPFQRNTSTTACQTIEVWFPQMARGKAVGPPTPGRNSQHPACRGQYRACTTGPPPPASRGEPDGAPGPEKITASRRPPPPLPRPDRPPAAIAPPAPSPRAHLPARARLGPGMAAAGRPRA